jgi:hypothetical protein
MKMAIVAAMLVPLVWAVPGHAETIVVGNALTDRAYLDPNFGYNKYTDLAVVDYTNAIPHDGKVKGFQYFARNTNPFYFIMVDGSYIVQWVSDKITPSKTGVNAYDLTTSPIPVQSGWSVGVYLISEGAIPFDFDSLGGSGAVLCLYNSPLPAVDSYFGFNDISNRTYSFAATVVTDEAQPGQSVDVAIVKYVDGTHAKADAAGVNSFPMLASWGSPNDQTIGGSDYFSLGPDGVNTVIPYEAKSPVIPVGSFYTVTEDTTQGAVGPNCANGQFSRLLGYTTGDNLNLAEKAIRTTTAPSLTNILRNQIVIVWNETCKFVNVTIVKYLDGKHADAASAQSNSFPMNASWSAANSSGSNTFALGPASVSTVNPYQAQSLPMSSGASYSVSEDTSRNTAGKTCADGQFSQLLGYTTGDTLELAAKAKLTTTAPSLRNIVSNKYVIVWNETCGTDDDDDECDNDDNGHHYGNDKGDHHYKCKHGDDHHKCKHSDNGHHYGNDKRDDHQSSNDKDNDKDHGQKGGNGGKR